MIDNVILLLTGTLHERDTRELLDKCHPLGEWNELAPRRWLASDSKLWMAPSFCVERREIPVARDFGHHH